jgi:hypothetical protein
VDEEQREIGIVAEVMRKQLAKLGQGPATTMVITWPSGQISVTGCTGSPDALVSAYWAEGCTVERRQRSFQALQRPCGLHSRS